MKRVVLVAETLGWAFHNISKQIVKAFSDRYDFQIIAREDELGPTECDVVVYFWWKSALRAKKIIRARRVCIGMYDHWSISREPARFQQAASMASVLFAGNEAIRDDLRLRAPSKLIELTEDGVDLELFKPQPYPEEFTIGWTGNRVYETIGLGDLKGVRLIEEAAEKAGVKLVIADKQVKQVTQAEMPDQFYRNISCYVCASLCEGTPNPVLEALACGRQVVSTNVGIVPKVVLAGYNGAIVDRTLESLVMGINYVRDRGNRKSETTNSVIEWDWKEKVKAFGPVLEGG